MSKADTATLKAMGIPAEEIAAKVRAQVANNTTKVEGGKVKPPAEWVMARVHEAIQPAHLVGVEAWVEEQIASLV